MALVLRLVLADTAVEFRPQPVVAADSQEVGSAARLQHHPQPSVGPVHLVAQHPLAGHAGIQGAGDHRARDLGLGPERDVLGDLGRATTLAVLGPGLR
jgi:hypothetical protein